MIWAQTPSARASSADKTKTSSASVSQFDRIAKQAAQARDQSKPEEAIRLYRQALRLKPSWPEGWWDLGAILYDADRYAEGRKTFRRLTIFNPNGAPAR